MAFNFQDMISAITQFWADQGCLILHGHDLEVGAGTYNPATFLRCLDPEEYSAVYVEPSRRPKDGGYGRNPKRVHLHHQLQVILKPPPKEGACDLYARSLKSIGFDSSENTLDFFSDGWGNATLGASGFGFEVSLDEIEISQITYFEKIAFQTIDPPPLEITYGLERLALNIQGVDSFFDLRWNDKFSYGDLYKRREREWSQYVFRDADKDLWMRQVEDFILEAGRCLSKNLPIPAYDFVVKASHAFNVLCARTIVSDENREKTFEKISSSAKLVGDSYCLLGN